MEEGKEKENKVKWKRRKALKKNKLNK